MAPGFYGTTAQDEDAMLEAVKLVDFSPIILLRIASDFDRQYTRQVAVTNLLTASGGAGFRARYSKHSPCRDGDGLGNFAGVERKIRARSGAQ